MPLQKSYRSPQTEQQGNPWVGQAREEGGGDHRARTDKKRWSMQAAVIPTTWYTTRPRRPTEQAGRRKSKSWQGEIKQTLKFPMPCRKLDDDPGSRPPIKRARRARVECDVVRFGT